MSKGEQDIALSKRSASLFAAAKREHIPGDAQEKLLASLSLGTGAATIAAAASTTSTVAQTALRTKLLWVCTSVSVVALGIYGAAALRRAPATTPATAMTPASASTAQASAVLSAAPQPLETIAMASPTPTHVTSQTSLPHSPSAAHVALTAAPAATADAWESEAEALAVARGALRAGNTTEALARLETYFAAFPHGHLELEARVLRIRAYAKSEATRARARSEAAALRKAQPNSAYDEELKALLSP